MKFIHFNWITLVFLSFFLSNCSESDDNSDVGSNRNPLELRTSNMVVELENERFSSLIRTDSLISASIQGTVTNQNNLPVSGATVTVLGTDIVTSTNANGVFSISNLPLNAFNSVIKIEQDGYFNGYKSFMPSVGNNVFDIQIFDRGILRNFVSEEGGTVIFREEDSISMSFSPSVLLRTDDSFQFNGTVSVFANYINPTDENYPNQIPGRLIALTDADTLAPFFSYGIVHSEAQNPLTQEILEVIKDSTYTFRIPALENAPEIVNIYRFNEDNGLWVQKGTASKIDGEYVATVNHISTWTVGVPIENSLNANVSFFDENNLPFSEIDFEIFDENYQTLYYRLTSNENGELDFNGVPDSLGVRILLPCDTIDYPINLSENQFVVADSLYLNFFRVNLNGELRACGEDPYTLTDFNLSSPEIPEFKFDLKTDRFGNYTTSFNFCEQPETLDTISVIYQIQISETNTISDTTKVLLNKEMEQTIELDFCE